jgi:hypothetical protein
MSDDPSQSNNQNDVLRAQDSAALFRENETLRQRLAALERDTVVQGRFVGEAPRYLVNEPGVYLDDTHFPGGTTIDYIGEPNMSMVPINDPAKRAMAELIERLEIGAREVAHRNGRSFFGLTTDRGVLLDTAMADAKRQAQNTPTPVIAVPQPTSGVPAMPHLDQGLVKRGPGRPPKVVAAQAAQPQKPDLGAPRLAPAPTEAAIVGRVVR